MIAMRSGNLKNLAVCKMTPLDTVKWVSITFYPIETEYNTMKMLNQIIPWGPTW